MSFVDQIVTVVLCIGYVLLVAKVFSLDAHFEDCLDSIEDSSDTNEDIIEALKIADRVAKLEEDNRELLNQINELQVKYGIWTSYERFYKDNDLATGVIKAAVVELEEERIDISDTVDVMLMRKENQDEQSEA